MEVPGALTAGPETAPKPVAVLDRRDFTAIAASLAIALGSRLYYWLRFDPPMSGDFQHYYFLATSLLHGDLRHFVHYHYPPLYPLTLAPLAALLASPEAAARLAGIFAASLTVIPLYFLGRRIFGRPVATAGAVLYALTYWQISVQGGAEPLLILLVAAGAALGLPALEAPTARRVAVTAAVFGLATLAKMEGMAFFGLWFLWLAALLIAMRPRLRAAGLAALAVGCFFLPQSPYLGAFYADTGRLTLNPKLATLFYIHNEPDWSGGSYALHRDANGIYTVFQRAISEGDRRQDLSLLDYLARNRDRIAGLYADRLGFVFRSIVPALLWVLVPGWTWVAAIFLLLALARTGWTRQQARREFYLWSFALLPMLLVPVFAPEMRFFAFTLAVLTLAVGRGAEQAAWRIAWLIGRARRESTDAEPARRARRQAWTLATLVVLLAVPDLGLMATTPTKSDYRALVEDRTPPAAFIREHLDSDRKIMSMWLTAPFWHLAGIAPERDLGIPLAPLKDIIAYARQEKVEFIVLEKTESRDRYPDLQVLFRHDFNYPDLRPVYAASSQNGSYYVICWVKDDGSR